LRFGWKLEESGPQGGYSYKRQRENAEIETTMYEILLTTLFVPFVLMVNCDLNEASRGTLIILISIISIIVIDNINLKLVEIISKKKQRK